jgi:hypothetical protein
MSPLGQKVFDDLVFQARIDASIAKIQAGMRKDAAARRQREDGTEFMVDRQSLADMADEDRAVFDRAAARSINNGDWA